MSSFFDLLDAACTLNSSLLCIGLDPEPSLIPKAAIFDFNRQVVDYTKDLVCAYKPNLAFYEAEGIQGIRALEKTVNHIRKVAPKVIIIGDGKRGDIGNTAQKYAHSLFEVWGFDATTVNAYGGHDTIQPFTSYKNKGTFIWCRSSNPSAKDFQDRNVISEDEDNQTTLYEVVAKEAKGWNENKNIGLVLGATFPDTLNQVRTICPELPFLIPAVGAQGGNLEASVRNGVDMNGRRAIISSSRAILYPSRDKHSSKSTREMANAFRNAINDVLTTQGYSW
jgi:orotidine-5'-phosphate decarboxylase